MGGAPASGRTAMPRHWYPASRVAGAMAMPYPAATSVIAMSKVLTTCSCGASPISRCTRACHGSPQVDCAQMRGCFCSSWHGTSRWISMCERLATATASMSCHNGSHTQPGHSRSVDDSAKSKPSSSDLLAGPAAAHLTNAAEVSGSSARCSASSGAVDMLLSS